ncbi:DUF1501 domain-containing protein [Vibrio sp. HN007]|uniref:DUF1501 domain-containing protein n=1 Tax=Vibrio iocasae TaxID=3098914 RepID=UPI0035D3EF73
MKGNNLTRREFVKASGMAMIGTSLMLAGCKSDSSNKQTPKNSDPDGAGSKAMVFIMLDGGNDAYNTLVPTSTAGHQIYSNSRNNLALAKDSLLQLNSTAHGLHPSLTNMQRLFNEKSLSFVANVGPMVTPITRDEFKAGSKPVPLGLMSHSDQFKHWQTANPGVRTNTGLFGKVADKMQPNQLPQDIPMNISLAGSNILQSGVSSREYVVTEKGSVGLKAKDSTNPTTRALNEQLLDGFDSLLAKVHNDAFLDTYTNSVKYAQQQHEKFSSALSGVHINTSFENTPLSKQLEMVAKSIAAKSRLGSEKQTFFIRYIGWDHHSELLKTHANMLKVLDNALGSFQSALDELGIADDVVTVVGSDFGRTLTSNGNGSDHGWGGNAIVMGKDINGGQIFGKYPSLELGNANPLDIGNGVLIPTTSTDEMYAELLMWFGIKRSDLGSMLPNLTNFYDYQNRTDLPLGFIRT